MQQRFIICLVIILGACSSDDTTQTDPGIEDIGSPDVETSLDTTSDDSGTIVDNSLTFGVPGPIAGPEGKGSFRFGAATAATQIEDQNPATDWWVWTAPKPEGLGNHTFVGQASGGFTRAVEDVALLSAMSLDRYRFSVEWSRVEPERDAVSEEALAHYDAVLDALVAAEISPMITVHHFSSPVWVDDPRDLDCPSGPTDANLCGWGHETGADAIIEEIAEHAGLLAARYGDRVDDWCTLNEPINYIISSHGVGLFPPGRNMLFDFHGLMGIYRNYLRAHVAIYAAIKANDTVDADGDGVAANVGLTLNVVEWAPAFMNQPSTHPDDVAAAKRLTYLYHHLYPQSLLDGTFDADADGVPDEQHPDWAGTLDWLGVQYYARLGVSGQVKAIPVVDLMPCFGEYDLGACLPPDDETHWVPDMQYEFYIPGLYNILSDFSERWPTLPMTITEAGLATNDGVRRAEQIVRSLEQIHRAIEDGADIRGYYHWSLYDNFEWAEGYEPRFGLYTVDFDTFERTPTEGATVLGTIAASRRITTEQRSTYGGLGPMTPESP